MPSYLIETYLPRSRSGELPAVVDRLRRATESLAAEGAPVRHLRSTFLPERRALPPPVRGGVGGDGRVKRAGVQRSSLPESCRRSPMHQEVRHEDPSDADRTRRSARPSQSAAARTKRRSSPPRPRSMRAERQVQLERDPYDLRCADLTRQARVGSVHADRAVRAGRRRQDPPAQPPARLAEHLLRASPRSARASRGRSSPPSRRSPAYAAASTLPTSGRPDPHQVPE